jgi:hypothetical protein
MGSSVPWTDTVRKLIEDSRTVGKPVWLASAVETIRREHPDCALSDADLAEVVRQATIEQHWSLGG